MSWRPDLIAEQKTPYAAGVRPYVWNRIFTATKAAPPPELGDSRTFVPASFDGEHQQGLTSIRPDAEARVTGAVVYVNEAHRWYRVRFELPGGVPAFECFKY